MGHYTDYLYAHPSFSEGVGSVLDLFGTLQEYNKRLTPKEADERALWNDFCAVAEDLKNSVSKSEPTKK